MNINTSGMPGGIKKFFDDLPSKVRLAGTPEANIDCEKCGTNMPVIKMNIFVYPDEELTTKALCKRCVNEEYLKHHLPLKN